MVLESFLEEVRLNQKSEGSLQVCQLKFPLASERSDSNQDSSLSQRGESKHSSELKTFQGASP